ncbi:odorant-binding protein 2b-like [Castor canadensis]|uniref:Odorant-binding protein 2b-like n=1 Tax=Castor canadensis TaxID=51338 RepID=A0AC58KV29_CASCN
MPIPEKRKAHPLPPFTLAINKLERLEFRMNIMKPIGCIQFKLPLDEYKRAGIFYSWWRHKIFIYFLPGKKHAIASYKDKVNKTYQMITMLMGRTLDENPEALKNFMQLVNDIGLKTTDIVNPSHVDACQLTEHS